MLGVIALTVPAHGQTLEGEQARALARQRGLTVRAVRPGGRVIELVRFVDGKPQYLTTLNSFAASTSSTNLARDIVSDLTIDGSNIPMAMWDGGHARVSHREFGGRVTLGGDGAFALDEHATHVAGSILASGVHSNAKGMANNGTLRTFNWSNDLAEMTAENIRLSNHSYGDVCGWDLNGVNANAWTWMGELGYGHYNAEASNWDSLAYDRPGYLILLAAGNDRGFPGPAPGTPHYHDNLPNVFTDNHPLNGPYDCIATKGTAKNILTVGAVEDIFGGWNQPSNVVMSSFSSWGPTNDGRIKPDIVTNGVELVSSTSGADDSYGSKSGTSMATPVATGNAAVMLNYWNQLHTDPGNPPATRSATLKGLIIHTAREAGPNDGPDYMFGWGLFDTLNASVGIKLDRYQPDAIEELTLYDGGVHERKIPNVRAGDRVKVTICWTDPAHAAISPSNMLNALRNDLDLRVIHNATLTAYYPWTLDPANPSAAAVRTGDNDRDNVEVVEFTAVHAGDYTVRVNHKAFLVSAHQDFTLFVNGWYPDVAYVPNTISLELLNQPSTAHHAVLLEGNYDQNPTLSQPCTLFSSGGTVTIGI